MLVRVESRRFIAGLEVQDGVVIATAPVLRRIRHRGGFYYLVGKQWDEVERLFDARGWKVICYERDPLAPKVGK